AKDKEEAGRPFSLRSSFPAVMSHRRMVWSQLPEASTLPSREKDNDSMHVWCPSSLRSSLPVATSHSRTALGLPSGRPYTGCFLSLPPEASVLPSGAKDIVKTASGCSSLCSSLPLDTSHSRTTLSLSAIEASVLLSDEKERERVKFFSCPCRTR